MTEHITPTQIAESAEAQIPVIDTFEDAVKHTRSHIAEFSYIGRFGIKDGVVTASRLMQGVDQLVAETESEDANPHLAEFTTLMAQISAKQSFDIFNPTKDPMVSFLISRGAYEKFKPVSLGEVTHDDSVRTRKLGHQLLADGQVVRGEIVPGVGVRTSAGILRTRGTPRLHNH